MSKVKFETVTEATVKTSNSVDTSRVYDISANVRINNGTNVFNVDSGVVIKGNITVCTFNKWGDTSLNTNFQNVNDVMEMCAILTSVNSYIEEIEDAVSKGATVIINE